MQHSSSAVPRWWRWAAAAQQNTSNVAQIYPNSKRIEIRDNKVVDRYMYIVQFNMHMHAFHSYQRQFGYRVSLCLIQILHDWENSSC